MKKIGQEIKPKESFRIGWVFAILMVVIIILYGRLDYQMNKIIYPDSKTNIELDYNETVRALEKEARDKNFVYCIEKVDGPNGDELLNCGDYSMVVITQNETLSN